jgi:hypothetical protein
VEGSITFFFFFFFFCEMENVNTCISKKAQKSVKYYKEIG